MRLVKESKPAVEYAGRVVSDDGTHIRVEAPWTGPSVDLGVVTFQEGDLFVEDYWRDRWYAVKRCTGSDGVLKGWYCDACRPTEVEGDVLVSRDLELDLWVTPDRQEMVRLDEDEFEASGLAQSDPEAARKALAAMDELEDMAQRGAFPFHL